MASRSEPEWMKLIFTKQLFPKDIAGVRAIVGCVIIT